MRVGAYLALLLLAACAGDGSERATPLERAKASVERGDGTSALMILEREVARGMPREEAALTMGEAALLLGDTVVARQYLEPREFTEEEELEGLRALARVERLDGNFSRAAETLDSALAAGGDNAETWAEIARLRYASGAQTAAGEALDHALALDENSSSALEMKAQMVRDRVGLVSSLPWLERAVEADPENVELLGELAATLGDAGQAHRMLEATAAMRKLAPGHPRAFFLEAVLAARGGKMALARRLMWRTGRYFDDTPAGRLVNGVLEMHAGNPGLASRHFAALVELQPRNARARMLLASAFHDQGGDLALLDHYGAEDPARTDPYLAMVIGRALEGLGRREEAARWLDRAAQPSELYLAALPGQARLDEARSRFASNPADAAAGVTLARALVEADQQGDAADIARQLGARFPDAYDILIIRGDVAVASGAFGEASALYGRAAAIRQPWSLVLRRAYLQRSAGRLDLAAGLVSAHLLEHPLDHEAALVLASLQSGRGEIDHAGQLFATASPWRRRDPMAMGRQALVMHSLHQREDALRTARLAYALQPGNAALAEIYGRVLEAQGHRELASALLRRAGRSGEFAAAITPAE